MIRAAIAANRDPVIDGTVFFAATTTENDDAASYVAGTWYSSEPSVEEVDGVFQRAYVAQVLAGAAGSTLVLAEGEYFLWVKVVVNGQSIVKLAGKVKVL